MRRFYRLFNVARTTMSLGTKHRFFSNPDDVLDFPSTFYKVEISRSFTQRDYLTFLFVQSLLFLHILTTALFSLPEFKCVATRK